MADTNLLAQLLAGNSPLNPQMLGGYQGAQLSEAALNPAYAHNEGPFGALAKTLAGFAGAPMLRQAVEATTAARQAANPDLAKLLASSDPYATLGANYGGFNPVAGSQILQGATPGSVAEARKLAAEAALVGNQASAAARVGATPRPSTVAPAGGASPPASGGATGAPAFPTLRPQVAATDSMDEIAKLAPEARQAAIARITDPRARAALLARLQQMRSQNALRPPT